MTEQQEIWKDIPGYEQSYQVSTFGRIKNINPTRTKDKERMLKASVNKFGYLYIALGPRKNRRYFTVHQLVAMTFLNHVPNKHKWVIDHIDDDKTNNMVENIRIVSSRTNILKAFEKRPGASKYLGVSRPTSQKGWQAKIWHEGKRISLGRFETEEEASEAYQKALKQINDGIQNS